MLDSAGFRAQASFLLARTKAFFRGILAFLTGQPNRLLAFDEVSAKLHIGGPVHRGLQTVRLDQIIGSIQRYQDFDRAFLPTQAHTAYRWTAINRAWYEEVSLPPVLLYQVGEAYFVADGHHRVSVAREQGMETIEAEVRECRVRVPVTPDLLPEDLEVLGAKVDFLERTNLDGLRPDSQLETTILGGYGRVIEHIAVHRYFMGLDFQRDIGEAEAVEHWYDSVYLPVVGVIRQSDVLAAFPGRTETDFYLWVMDHRHYLVERGQADLIAPDAAAEAFVEQLDLGDAPNPPPRIQ